MGTVEEKLNNFKATSSGIEIRIHHFFDIIRDFGAGREIKIHPLGHSYHKVAKLIKENPNICMKLVVNCDSVCVGCSKMKKGMCIDTVSHRDDFTEKEEFNNHIDGKIMDFLGFDEGQITTPLELLDRSGLYVNNIFDIYAGNDKDYTEKRKVNVIKGIEKYKSLQVERVGSKD